MVKDYNENDLGNPGTTLPDYQNFRNVLFQQWQELNNAVVYLRISNKGEYQSWLKEVTRCFLKFYAQINDKSKLSHLSEKERELLKYYYNNPNDLSIKSSKIIVDVTRKLMSDYGVFNLEGNESGEIW